MTLQKRGSERSHKALWATVSRKIVIVGEGEMCWNKAAKMESGEANCMLYVHCYWLICWFNQLLTHSMIHSFTDLLIYILSNLLIDSLMHSLITPSLLLDSLIHSLTDSLIHWFSHSLAQWFANWLTHFHTHWLTHSLIDSLTQLFTDSLTGWLTDLFPQSFFDSLTHSLI